MAQLACQLSHVGGVSAGCAENFSGTGGYFLVALAADLDGTPEYDNTKAEFTEESFALKSGKFFYKIDIRQDSGQVTSTSNGKGKGFQNVLTGVVEDDMEKASFIMRIMNNADVVVLLPDGMGKYFVGYGAGVNMTMGVESTSGAAATDDHGHTLTFTITKSFYPQVKWAGTPTIAEETAAEPGA